MKKKKTKERLDSFQETQLGEEYKNLIFTIVLVEPEHTGNIGSVARIMKNFDFKNLVIFNPKESVEHILSYEAQGFAMHGKEILLNAEIIVVKKQNNYFSEFQKLIERFDYIIATTAKGQSHSNIRRLAIFPEDLTLPISNKPLKIAILFGKESRGLTNDDISYANLILRIPTKSEYSALNLSHACGIILYEIFKKTNILNIGRGKHPVLVADSEDRLELYKIIQEIIDKLKIRTYKKGNVFFAFKNIFGRSFMSKRELSLILGLFSKVNSILEGLNLYNK